MSRLKKNTGEIRVLKMNHCHICRKQFRSRSHYDALCDVCWADNEMKPYVVKTRGYRGTGMMN